LRGRVEEVEMRRVERGRDARRRKTETSQLLFLTWRGTQVQHGAALVQDPELAVELDELEGRTGAVAVCVMFFCWREEKGMRELRRGIRFR